ncbi:Peptide-N4-(N-acetyl-beta-glucosaminyl)asparagine amidase A [Thalictrum thalictroides]|uniref:Peptide-N4-(N-acetyl-beta-glucosaminyl)asparagine amidase A n=1 Tax=Thalictrum thalictroides TaxID=46969 RepID=A0A7J6UUE3_THATH|nr:Peptide-N4-(N-acetyl-beta-glucosaminyl)asparagine amidase A [Thalictrum thalictroides]
MEYLLLLLFFSLCTTSTSSSSSHLPDHFFKSNRIQNASSPAEYLEVTKPLFFDHIKPSCTLLLLQHDFAYTYGLPPASTLYAPPSDCPGPWTHIVLQFYATCKGEQYDRIVGIWLDGVEILRTSTPEPTESGIFWKVRKDVTRYSSLLSRSNLTLTVMLENIVSQVFTGIYHVNVSLLYYNGEEAQARIPVEPLGFISELKPQLGIKIKEELLDEKNADLIIPVCSDGGNDGFWFRIQNEKDVHFKQIQIPMNSYKVVLEIYVSFHGNDEFWYSNPPDSYIELNHLTTPRGNGAFRQVFVTIDGVFAGFVMPFPVIFTGGINPLFWEPVVAIGAFDLPSYDLDLSPFLGLLLDGKSHSFGIGVTDSIPFWLVDANLHLWLDSSSPTVMAKSVMSKVSAFNVKRKSKFQNLDGKFQIDSERKIEFSGWVNSSIGNLTTYTSHEFKFKNKIKFKNHGQFKEVEQKIKVKTEVKVESDTGEPLTRKTIKRKYPLHVQTSTVPGLENNTDLLITNVSHVLYEKHSFRSSRVDLSRSVSNNQVCGGWMVVQDHSVLSGDASTDQTLVYKDEAGCYSRTIFASSGKVLRNNSTLGCTSSL